MSFREYSKNLTYKMRNRSKYLYLPNWIILFYGLIETFKYVRVLPTMTTNLLGCVLGIISIVYCFKKKHIPSDYIIFFVVYTIMGGCSHIYNGNIDWQELLWPVFFGGIALLLLLFDINENFAVFPIYFFSIAMFLNLLKYGAIYQGMDLSESRNYSSAYLLSFYSIYLIARSKNNQDSVNFIPLIIASACAFLSYGRGGILSFSLLLILLSLYSLQCVAWGSILYIKVKYAMFFIIMLMSIYILFSFTRFHNLIEIGKNTLNALRDKDFVSVSRYNIWTQYIEKILETPVSILLAPRIGGTYLLDQFHSNLHNSYLMLYARYGTFVFLLILYKSFKSVKSFIKQKNWILTIVFFTVFVRCATDCISYNGVMDITWYYLLFAPKYNLKRKLKVTK